MLSQTDNHLVNNSIFRVGQVVEVVGQEIKVKVDSGKNTSSLLYKGEILQNISVGGYIKIKKGFEIMIGKIEGESVKEGKAQKSKYSSNKEKIQRILSVKILGFLVNGSFKRGVKELPLIDNTCFLLTKEEFNEIHNFLDLEDKPIRLGVLEYDDGQIISLGINKLFASHIGIFGNTGSGKSYTLTKLFRELFKQFKDEENFRKNAEFFLIDFNGEYVGKLDEDLINYESEDVILEKEYKNVYELSTRKKISEIEDDQKFPVNPETLKDVTFWSIFLEATDKTQTPFLNRVVRDTFLEGQLESDSAFVQLILEKVIAATSVSGDSVDSTITQDFLYELANYLNNDSIRRVANYFKLNLGGGSNRIDFYIGEGINRIYSQSNRAGFDGAVREQVSNISDVNLSNFSAIKRVGLRVIIKYYDEMIRGFSNREHLSPLLKRLDERIKDLDKVLTVKGNSRDNRQNFSIVSLKDVNLRIRKMVPMLLAKELYEQKKANKDKRKSLHIIIDEAHNILSRSSDRESDQWKDYRLETFEEIIKEGRKFGTFLTISSQRPSDISPTIISQLHNYFLHRLINNNDLKAVETTIAYLDKVSADSIPNLATGTCILAGLIAQIPVVMKVGKIEQEKYEPQSQNIDLLKNW